MVRFGVPLDATRVGGDAQELAARLGNRIVGQDDAIEQIVNVYQLYLTGLSASDRPVGTFLFLGPTGSGKTRTVEAMAEILFGTRAAVVKIDCGEFQHSHEIAKLIGSPPGYIGHRETHPVLSQEVLDQYHTQKLNLSLVLFDEIEKASDALWNLLLGILDRATLTLGDGGKVDFSHSMIFMTSNLGASAMAAIMRPGMGFTVAEPGAGERAGAVDEKMSKAGVEAARRKFSPEFMNRLDKVVVFRALTEADLRRILDIELEMVQERIHSVGDAFDFELTDAAKGWLLRDGLDIRYGARHLKRAVERNLVQRLANLIATGQVRAGDVVQVDFDPQLGRLVFFRLAAARVPEPGPVEAVA